MKIKSFGAFKSKSTKSICVKIFLSIFKTQKRKSISYIKFMKQKNVAHTSELPIASDNRTKENIKKKPSKMNIKNVNQEMRNKKYCNFSPSGAHNKYDHELGKSSSVITLWKSLNVFHTSQTNITTTEFDRQTRPSTGMQSENNTTLPRNYLNKSDTLITFDKYFKYIPLTKEQTRFHLIPFSSNTTNPLDSSNCLNTKSHLIVSNIEGNKGNSFPNTQKNNERMELTDERNDYTESFSNEIMDDFNHHSTNLKAEMETNMKISKKPDDVISSCSIKHKSDDTVESKINKSKFQHAIINLQNSNDIPVSIIVNPEDTTKIFSEKYLKRQTERNMKSMKLSPNSIIVKKYNSSVRKLFKTKSFKSSIKNESLHLNPKLFIELNFNILKQKPIRHKSYIITTTKLLKKNKKSKNKLKSNTDIYNLKKKESEKTSQFVNKAETTYNFLRFLKKKVTEYLPYGNKLQIKILNRNLNFSNFDFQFYLEQLQSILTQIPKILHFFIKHSILTESHQVNNKITSKNNILLANYNSNCLIFKINKNFMRNYSTINTRKSLNKAGIKYNSNTIVSQNENSNTSLKQNSLSKIVTENDSKIKNDYKPLELNGASKTFHSMKQTKNKQLKENRISTKNHNSTVGNGKIDSTTFNSKTNVKTLIDNSNNKLPNNSVYTRKFDAKTNSNNNTMKPQNLSFKHELLINKFPKFDEIKVRSVISQSYHINITDIQKLNKQTVKNQFKTKYSNANNSQKSAKFTNIKNNRKLNTIKLTKFNYSIINRLNDKKFLKFIPENESHNLSKHIILNKNDFPDLKFRKNTYNNNYYYTYLMKQVKHYFNEIDQIKNIAKKNHIKNKTVRKNVQKQVKDNSYKSNIYPLELTSSDRINFKIKSINRETHSETKHSSITNSLNQTITSRLFKFDYLTSGDSSKIQFYTNELPKHQNSKHIHEKQSKTIVLNSNFQPDLTKTKITRNSNGPSKKKMLIDHNIELMLGLPESWHNITIHSNKNPNTSINKKIHKERSLNKFSQFLKTKFTTSSNSTKNSTCLQSISGNNSNFTISEKQNFQKESNSKKFHDFKLNKSSIQYNGEKSYKNYRNLSRIPTSNITQMKT